MMIYNAIRLNAALSTTVDFMTIIAGATRSSMLLELDAQGAGTASSHNDVGVFAVTTAGSGTAPTAVVPQSVDRPNMTGTTPAIAYSGLVYVGAYGTTQPTLAAVPVHPFGVNANGQRYYWRCLPNLSNALVMPGGNNAAATLSIRSVTGTSNISLRAQIAEL